MVNEIISQNITSNGYLNVSASRQLDTPFLGKVLLLNWRQCILIPVNWVDMGQSFAELVISFEVDLFKTTRFLMTIFKVGRIFHL